MPPFLLALCSSVLFGASDFAGGWASRRNATLLTLLVSQLVSVLGLSIICVLLGGRPEHSDFLWAIGTGAALSGGLALLYTAMARGRMSEVTPVASIMAILLPALLDPVWLNLPVYIGFGLAILAVLTLGHDVGAKSESKRSVLPIFNWSIGW